MPIMAKKKIPAFHKLKEAFKAYAGQEIRVVEESVPKNGAEIQALFNRCAGFSQDFPFSKAGNTLYRIDGDDPAVRDMVREAKWHGYHVYFEFPGKPDEMPPLDNKRIVVECRLSPDGTCRIKP